MHARRSLDVPAQICAHLRRDVGTELQNACATNIELGSIVTMLRVRGQSAM